MHLVRLVAALLLAAAAALMGVGPATADSAGVGSSEPTAETSVSSIAGTPEESTAPAPGAAGAGAQARVTTTSRTLAAEPPCDTQPDLPICNDEGEVDPCQINPDSPDCTEGPPPPNCDEDPTAEGCTEVPEVPEVPEEPEEPEVPELPEDPGLPGDDEDDDNGGNNNGNNNGNPGGNNGGNSGGNSGGITTGEGQPNTPPSAEGNGGPAVPTGIVPGLVERPVVATLSSCSDPALCQATEPENTPVAASTGPTLPATGAGESTPYVLVGGLALILVGGVLLRRGSGIASAPAGKHAAR